MLTPEERAKALVDLKEKYAKEKADSDSVTANSEDELLEGKVLGYEDDNVKKGSGWTNVGGFYFDKKGKISLLFTNSFTGLTDTSIGVSGYVEWSYSMTSLDDLSGTSMIGGMSYSYNWIFMRS